jgi:ribosome-binding protein aMBF1 (putative translation factor)
VTERREWFGSADVTRMPTREHPNDSEDLVRLVTLTRQEEGWTQARLAEAAGTTEAEVARFEALQTVPAEPLAMRFLEVMGRV